MGGSGIFSNICRITQSASACNLSTLWDLKSRRSQIRKQRADIWRLASTIANDLVLPINRLRFHLSFKNEPADGEYCNSKHIRLFKQPATDHAHRPFLVIIRCGARHGLVDDASDRNFDIALNLYAPPDPRVLEACEYAYSGGVNKYKAAKHFLSGAFLDRYRGVMLLDDDLEIAHSQLSKFLDYCWSHEFELAQPSLTLDSSWSHKDLLNASSSGWRPARIVEVMCPYFSSCALRLALTTFDLSYSTWGLDYVWPTLITRSPVVVDAFTIRHAKLPDACEGAFYRYLRGIGVSPQREAARLKRTIVRRLR
jgi:hypothetical protein